jgi:glycosyltransferase involved in cell wall biosynthesis
MRLAFVDPGPLVYDLDSPGQIPLGGSESALCHLTKALSQAGHEVYFLKGTAPPRWHGRVRALPLTPALLRELRPLDAVIVLNAAEHGAVLRGAVGWQTKLVLWMHQAPDQPVLKPLHDTWVRDAYDGWACVSRWLADLSSRIFGLDPQRAGVLRNAVAPWFLELFSSSESILAAKPWPPVLAYTSTPYRGLDRLLEMFPQICAALPGVGLRVFSSMQVYQMPAGEEASHFARLYERSRTTNGVEYAGSVSQAQLAARLRDVNVLAYPNTYAETSSIAVMEAMAAGCRVITSDLAALPETTAGFATLIPTQGPGDWELYNERFLAAMTQELAELADPAKRTRLEERLRRQVDFVHEQYTWTRRGSQWCEWLSGLALRRG